MVVRCPRRVDRGRPSTSDDGDGTGDDGNANQPPLDVPSAADHRRAPISEQKRSML